MFEEGCCVISFFSLFPETCIEMGKTNNKGCASGIGKRLNGQDSAT